MAELAWRSLGPSARQDRQTVLAWAEQDGFLVVAKLLRDGGRWTVRELEIAPDAGRTTDPKWADRTLKAWHPHESAPVISAAMVRDIRVTDLLADIYDRERAAVEVDDAGELESRAVAAFGQLGSVSPRVLGFRRRVDLEAHARRLAAAFVYGAAFDPAPIHRVADELDLNLQTARDTVRAARAAGFLTAPGRGVGLGHVTEKAQASLVALEIAIGAEE